MAEDKDDVIRKMAALREGFKAGLDDRLRDLEAALDGLTPDGNADQTARTLETLHGLCHKLRGAAGTFGFAALSEIAGQLDDLTKALLDQGRSLDDGEREALWRLLSSLKAASVGQEGLSISDAAAWESLVTAREADGEVSMTVILVDDDEAFLELVRNQLSHFGFDVLALADHAELRNAVAATPPAAVIMDVAFPGDADAGVTTIRALRDEGIVSCPVVFLSVRGDLPARLGAVRAGCDG
ncbi:MAG: response regulator, partial [Alphaproteobacteria bacterium]|nr:response regulator [Alphaproteobacteria bacterium]